MCGPINWHVCVRACHPSCGRANDYGQLGLEDTWSRGDGPEEMGTFLPAVDLGKGFDVTALTSRGAHVCALLKPGGNVKCWG
jgi:hypothetical protein